ncbi:DNA-binding SARP family transcriptional activator [Deinococcus yavapaiensis KR-236]|uniref:DNA-binding SARP family transcriptional activator n=2 Tax=Deinococcus TaxID=1298 RepID=A0A318SIL4_9DEIO|nr:DNA-binding SARP family transcriptional activator [Deinococcus yavapaiensis KR-236]
MMGEHDVTVGKGMLRLLAILALDGPSTRSRLADLIWFGDTKRTLQSLRTALSELRKALGPHEDVLQIERDHLALDVTRVHVDVRHPPRETSALVSYWQEFMSGYRHVGTEAWLEWADVTESRLFEEHLQALLAHAAAASLPEAEVLLRQAFHLAPHHPQVLTHWTAFQNARRGPSDEELLRAMQRTAHDLWLTAQERRERQDAANSEEQRAYRTSLLDHLGRAVTVAFLPRRPLDATAWSQDVLSTYRLRDHAGAESIARQILQRHSKGLTAALAMDVLANLAIDQGQYHRGRHLAERALTLVDEPTSEVAFTAAYSNVILGVHDRAASIARGALRTLPALDSPAMLYAILARVGDATQQYRAARHWHELALQAARQHDDPFVLPQVISFMLWHFNITGDPQRSLSLARDGLMYGAPTFSSHLVNALGFSHLLRRDFETAFEAFAPQRESVNVTGAATSWTCSALALHWMGESHEAERALRISQELLPLTDNGNVKFEWAAAALTIDPLQWAVNAEENVRGVVSSDPTVPQWYERLKATRLP